LKKYKGFLLLILFLFKKIIPCRQIGALVFISGSVILDKVFRKLNISLDIRGNAEFSDH